MSFNPEAGRRFGPYEIQSRLGGGGMGHVFRAWDARLHREVAIKLLHDEYAMSGMRERFLREARAASALNHPNICTIFDIGEQDGDPYLVMELLEGETLRDRITLRPLPTEEIVCIAKEVAEALGAAHSKGVIHRDIKPANIFLVSRPNMAVQAKVLDFGLAKIEGGVLGARQNRLDLTTAGSTVGTLAYMSPEQARGEPLDSRSDLFSLGVVLYEMATRHVPFPGATSALVFVKLLNQAPEPVRDWNEAVPRELERIILKLMAKERTARFQTAQELVDALAHVNDKPAGGWLRKAVATVPLVRAPDPVARNKRPAGKRHEEGYDSPPQRAPAPAPAMDTPRPSSGTEAAQVLRPVARMPRGDTTPRPLPDIAEDPVPKPGPVIQTPTALPEQAAGPAIAPTRAPSVVVAAAHDPAPHPEDAQTASGEFAAATADPFEESPGTRGKINRRRNGIISAIAAAVLLALVLGLLFLRARGHFGAAMLSDSDAVVITDLENRTGDHSLDGAGAQALQFALAQSPYLRLRSDASYNIVQHQRTLEGQDPDGPVAARDLAKRLGTRAYLFGSIKGDTPPYLLHVDLLNTATGDPLTSADERASSVSEVPAAIDRMAATLRAAIGEPSDSIARSHNPLSHEATSSIDALHAYTQADSAQSAGHVLDALRFYQLATKIDPHFLQAHLRLAAMYRKLRAGVSQADSARRALAASDNASERMRALAQAEYEIDVSGDFVRATGILRHEISSFPHDATLLELLARALRQQGRMTEALQAAQQSIEEDQYHLESYTEAEDALIGLDRYDAAFQMEGQVEKLGVMRRGISLTSAYLEHRYDIVATSLAFLEKPHTGFRPDWALGVYLDNTGKLIAGAALWRNRSLEAAQVKELASASSFLLSQGALDDALAGQCTGALSLARDSDDLPQSMVALFNSGMAHALCGSPERARAVVAELQKLYPQSFAVGGFYLPDLKAAIALHEGDPAAALEFLKPARQYDLISLTPYLRGMAHVALRQVQIGIVDYQTVLAHRGVTFLAGNNVYPVAEIGVARAFADTGDTGNSAEAYRRFLDLWRDADAGQTLVAEARAHVK